MKTQDIASVVIVGLVMLGFGWVSLTPQLVSASDLRGAGVGDCCRSVSSDGCQGCNETFTYCTGELNGWVCRNLTSGGEPVMECKLADGCDSEVKKESCSTE